MREVDPVAATNLLRAGRTVYSDAQECVFLAWRELDNEFQVSVYGRPWTRSTYTGPEDWERDRAGRTVFISNDVE